MFMSLLQQSLGTVLRHANCHSDWTIPLLGFQNVYVEISENINALHCWILQNTIFQYRDGLQKRRQCLICLGMVIRGSGWLGVVQVSWIGCCDCCCWLHKHFGSWWNCSLLVHFASSHQQLLGLCIQQRWGSLIFFLYLWLVKPVLRIHHDVVALSSGNHKPMDGEL
jgi:hypothetical protein